MYSIFTHLSYTLIVIIDSDQKMFLFGIFNMIGTSLFLLLIELFIRTWYISLIAQILLEVGIIVALEVIMNLGMNEKQVVNLCIFKIVTIVTIKMGEYFSRTNTLDELRVKGYLEEEEIERFLAS